MTLGFKGLGLKQMASYKHRVPEGFILSTELFSAWPAMSYRPLYDDTLERVRTSLNRLESETGLRLGDPSHLLTLSIRSGAAISMPGLMTTFVDVGLNDRLAEALSRKPGFEWAAWDSYRRFLQSWAMASGVDRDFFDGIMTEFKVRYGIERKLDFLPEHMRELAFTYKARARELGVRFTDDPFRQVVACIRKVLQSWDSPEAQLYRRYIGVAEEWGTAVVVQRMVFGNLSRESGSGVTFTRNPSSRTATRCASSATSPPGARARTWWEVWCSPGLSPRPSASAVRPTAGSSALWKRTIPRSTRRCWRWLATLLTNGSTILRRSSSRSNPPRARTCTSCRNARWCTNRPRMRPTSTPHHPAYGPPTAVGMGVAGGAYSGRVAINAQQIDRLVAEAPNDTIVLLRPDTVPEDIAMITRVEGLLTARGGATSHAAVTAKRLGKTAVVDCRELEVIEHQGTARLAGSKLKAGDWLSIDGRTGNIFLGGSPRSPSRWSSSRARPRGRGGQAVPAAVPPTGAPELFQVRLRHTDRCAAPRSGATGAAGP